MIAIDFLYCLFRFDFASNKWSAVAPMSTRRECQAHVVLSGRLFAIGGCNRETGNQNSVEYYDPSTNKWQTVASMHFRRKRPAAHVSSNGFIYVVGGCDAIVIFQSIERYDPGENLWTQVITTHIFCYSERTCLK